MKSGHEIRTLAERNLTPKPGFRSLDAAYSPSVKWLTRPLGAIYGQAQRNGAGALRGEE
ncbi:hypothetical protein [Croceicoccus sp. YJ47]|uniref:hypothetical protein n=1 Tax=Croceicoccus sp. YJ47 TaxID=2798724 RepID=UPI0019238401|nr:hypothetical protein [Croceicoccus sp. YJ47]QQN74221.1 hypothetical protein JD971_16170 [Croceicoccus sp. YJ47]